MPIASCPHCGMKVHFGDSGVCPSCAIHREAPVTEADHQRMEQVSRNQAAHASGSGVSLGQAAGAGGGSIVVLILVKVILRLVLMSGRQTPDAHAAPPTETPVWHEHDDGSPSPTAP
jgi:hypothetical protein